MSATRIRHRDARACPRVHLHEPAQVVTESGASHPATVVDVTLGGLGLRCERPVAHALHPSGRCISGADGPCCEIRFRLRVGGQRHTLRLPCRLVHFRIGAAGGSVDIGLRFRHLVPEESARLVERFITEALCPVEAAVPARDAAS